MNVLVESLTKTYGSITAVDDLSFAVRRGEIMGLLGPNGAGKSTTLRILAGSLGASAGRALVGGLEVMNSPEAKARIGYLPEVLPLYPEMTVKAYLRYCAKLKRVTDVIGAVERVTQTVGLSDVSGRIIKKLSKGYKQRVGIAAALVHQPELLILDEPLSGLDPSQRKELRDLISALSKGDTTVIISTHVLAEVESLCDSVTIISDGRTKASGPISEFSDGGKSVILRVQSPSEALQNRLLEVEGVLAVSMFDESAYLVSTEHDVRDKLAAVAVNSGLIELRGQRGLEESYLRLVGAS